MTDIAELALRVDALEVKTANAELDRLSGTSKRVDRDVATFSANSSRSLEFVKTGVAALVAGFAGLSLSRSIKESIELNQRYKELGIAMEVVGRNVGIQSQQLNATTAALEKMGISMIEARQTVTRLAASHIDLANAEKLADLARNAAIVGQINTSEALDRIVHGIRSAEVEVLKTIGITVQFDQAYKQLAAQLGKTTNELSQQEKQQARINVVLGEAPALVGLYEAAMGNAGKQFRSTERLAENLKIKIGGIFDLAVQNIVKDYTGLLFDLDDQISDMVSDGSFEEWVGGIAMFMAGAADSVRTLYNSFVILGKGIGAAAAQIVAISKLDFASAIQIQSAFNEDFTEAFSNMTKFQDSVQKQIVARQLLTDKVTGQVNALRLKIPIDEKENKLTDEANKKLKQSRDERKEFINSLAKQAVEAGKSRIEIQRMEAALLGVSDAAEPYLRIIESQARAEEDLRVSRQQQADDLRKIESITQSVRTKQEIYNDTVKELDDLLSKGLGMEAYNRALSTAREELTKTEVKTREFWDTNEQIWIQGVRNVQTSLANGLFNVFDDGLSGMVKGVKRAVGQMIAEFASIKILQATGIAGLLGMGSTAAFASGGAASGGGLSSMISTGFGLTNLLGSGISGLGSLTGSGSLTAFGQAFTGDAIAGFAGQAGAFGASAGSAFSAVAAPALAIAAGTMIGSQIGGDKRVAGMSSTTTSLIGSLIGGPLGGIIGGGINAIFGRSKPKFEKEDLVGTVSAGGFEGVLNQAFKEKGGLVRSDRVSNFIADTDTGELLNQFGRLSESGNIPGALRDSATDPAVKRALEVGEFLDEAFGGIGDTLKITADKLGLSSDALNNFSIELDLVSAKGETLSEAQISEEITRISDAMIETLIPNLDELSKKGETSADTLNRLNAQFSVLESAAMLFGNTAEQAAEKVRALGLDGQTAFIESLGGVQVAANEIQEFYDIVFTDSQKLENTKNQILGILEPLGIGFVPTLEQLYDAVESGNPELIQAAFRLDRLVTEFDRLNASLLDVADPIKDIVETVEDLSGEMRALANERRAFTAARAERQRVEAEKFAAELGAIQAIKTEAESMRDAFLRSGDAAGAVMNELAIISENIKFTSAGAFNSALAKQIADASQAVANRASENALRVPNVSDFINTALQNITSDSIVTPIYLSIRDAIVDGSGDMSNAVRDSVDGFAKTIAEEQARLSRAPRGRGIASVLSAQSDLSFVSAAGFSGGQKQFGRDVLAYGEAIRKLDDRLSGGQIAASEYDGAIAGLNDVMGGAAKLFGDVESQFERIKNSGLALASSGINAIGFYFNDITKQVAELNKQASASGAAIAQTTDAIGRLKSSSFVFGQSVAAVFSGNAAAGISFNGSPETDKAALIGQAAGIAAQVLTTADAAKFAQQLAGEEAFSGLGSTGLRDVSLLLDGLKAFDPASFENAFLRINDALITGSVTQEQYNVLFNTALDEFEGLGTSAGGAKSALGQLREAARNLADELLLGDKSILSVFQKTSEAQRQYNEIIERARSGNATSGELSGGVNNLLDAQLNSASTKFEFDKQFSTVINDLRSIGQTPEDKRLEEQKKSNAELKAEIKQLREDLNAANVAIAKSTAKTADVLDRWSVVGLPATEV